MTDLRLADRVFAPHYAEASPRTVLSLTNVRADASVGARVLSELLPGDCFELLEISDSLGWGRCAADQVVGYIDATSLGEFVSPTHLVTHRNVSLHEAPNTNATVLGTLPMGSRIVALGERGDYLLTDHGYIPVHQVRDLSLPAAGPIAEVALRLLDAPAHVGGRSGAGVDDTGLIFLTHDVAGTKSPRFHDLIASSIAPARGAPDAGEVVIFDDHLAIMVDGLNVVHVDGRVVRTSLSSLVESGRYGPVIAHGRLG